MPLPDPVFVVLMQDMLTKAERTLLDAWQGDFVMQTRARFQMTMRDDYVARVHGSMMKTPLPCRDPGADE